MEFEIGVVRLSLSISRVTIVTLGVLLLFTHLEALLRAELTTLRLTAWESPSDLEVHSLFSWAPFLGEALRWIVLFHAVRQ